MESKQQTKDISSESATHNKKILVMLIIVLIAVAAIVGYMRLMEKQTITPEKSPKTETAIPETTTSPTIQTQPANSSTPSDEVEDIEADLKTTDVSF
jgi:flagellar basal body-associated protein FliL